MMIMTRATVFTDEVTAHDVEDIKACASILVVDDDASVRTSLRRLLEALGYDAVGAANSAEALRKARELTPDLIIMDLHLANESGVDAARAIRSVAALKRIPMIAMTSAGIDSEELRALFRVVLRKPFAATEMQSVLDAILEIRDPHHAASSILRSLA